MPTPPDGREHKAPKDKPAATKEEEVKANEKAKKGVKDTPAPPPPKPPTPLEGLFEPSPSRRTPTHKKLHRASPLLLNAELLLRAPILL